MSEEDRRLAVCAGKEQLTASIAKNIARRHKDKGRSTEAYKCDFCHYWHIGTKNFGVTKKRTRFAR